MVEDISCGRCKGTGNEPTIDPLDNVLNQACKACGGTGRGQSSAIGDQN